ncbi:LPXTG cell wall anchor domain-containing protein, partial [Gardnerella vaginalis]
KDGGNDWFKLPKTGAAGVIIFALVGLGLVGSGMFVFLKNRKKEEEQQAA